MPTSPVSEPVLAPVSDGEAAPDRLDVQTLRSSDECRDLYKKLDRDSKYGRAVLLGETREALRRENKGSSFTDLGAFVGVNRATAEEECLLFDHRPDIDSRFDGYSPSAIAAALRRAGGLEDARKLLKKYPTVAELRAYIAESKAPKGTSPGAAKTLDTQEATRRVDAGIDWLKRAKSGEREGIALRAVERSFAFVGPKNRAKALTTGLQELVTVAGGVDALLPFEAVLRKLLADIEKKRAGGAS